MSEQGEHKNNPATEMRHTNDLIASRFLDEHKDNPRHNYLYVEDQELVYAFKQHGYYTPIVDKDFGDKILHFMLNLKKHPEKAMKATQNITKAMMKDVVFLTTRIFPQRVPELRSHYITFNDGKVLNLKDFSIDHTARKYHSIFFVDAPSTVYLNPQPPEHFLSFLRQVCVLEDGKTTDESLIKYLQEVFGYCIKDSTELEQAYFFYGSGANGKSVLLNILKAMFPPEVMSANTLQSLTAGRFSLANLRGKRINITNEEESKYIKSDIFKKIVTGEMITCERKFQDQFEFAPQVKLIFATNKLPKLDGIERAIRRRIKIIPFYAEIPEDKQDPDLFKKLLNELPQIIMWAIQGLKRLEERGMKFQEPACLGETMKQFEIGQSSVVEFLYENFELTGNVDDVFHKTTFYDAYKMWCVDQNRKPLGRNNFYQELEARFKSNGVYCSPQPIIVPIFGDKRIRVVHGIKKVAATDAWINDKYQKETSSF